MQIKKSTYIMDRRGIVIQRKVEIITRRKGATSGLSKERQEDSRSSLSVWIYSMFAGIMHICTRLLLTTVQKRELI